MSPNVPAVTEGFLCPIKKCEAFYGRKKLWRRENRTKAKSTAVFRSPNRLSGEAVTGLLCDVPY